jgi:hypothetical protein
MHLDEEKVQRLLHGELERSQESSARYHLGTCSECRSRLTQAESEEAWVLDRLRRLDHAPPPLSVRAAVAAQRQRAQGWGRLAAGIFFALAAAGVAYAAPGSPLPRVLELVIDLITRPSERPAEAAASRNTGKPQAGIAVTAGNRLTILFQGDHSKDTAVVSLIDGTDVMVRALGGTTIFSSETDRLVVAHQGEPGRYEVLIPRMAPWIEIQVGGRRVLLKEKSRIVTEVRPESGGHYLIPLSDSKR